MPDKPGDGGKALPLAETEPQLCQVSTPHTDCGRSESPLRRSYKVFGFLNRSTAVLQNNHLLFHELRSLLGRVARKGQAANRPDQDSHPESMLFEVGAYLEALRDACENIGLISLCSNYSPCKEAHHRCISQIYSSC